MCKSILQQDALTCAAFSPTVISYSALLDGQSYVTDDQSRQHPRPTFVPLVGHRRLSRLPPPLPTGDLIFQDPDR